MFRPRERPPSEDGNQMSRLGACGQRWQQMPAPALKQLRAVIPKPAGTSALILRWGGFEIRRKPGNLDDLPLISRQEGIRVPGFLLSGPDHPGFKAPFFCPLLHFTPADHEPHSAGGKISFSQLSEFAFCSCCISMQV